MNPATPLPEQRRASVRDVEQTILSRIARGDYPVGHRLPSCERLGRQLGANKNTVSKAYQALAAKGYTVSTPGRGTFVTGQASGAWGENMQAEIMTRLSEVMAQGATMGISADELEALALTAIRDRLPPVLNPASATSTATAPKLASWPASSGSRLATTIEPLVVADVPPARSADSFDLLAVNIAHLRAVESRLGRVEGTERSQVVPMVVMPNADTVTTVAELASGTRLLILSDTEEVLHTLEGVARGVNPAIHVSGLLSSSPRLDEVLSSADAVLVTRTAQRRLGRDLRASTVIVASFKLDEQSVLELAGRRTALQQAQLDRAVRPRPDATARSGPTRGATPHPTPDGRCVSRPEPNLPMTAVTLGGPR